MAKDKKSFVLYTDQVGIFNKLTDEQAGALIKHIFKYCNDENPSGDFVTELAFESIKQQLKRDLVKYEVRADKSRQNGLLGGRPKNLEEPKEPTGLINNLTEPRKPDTVTVTVTDTVINKDSIDFDALVKIINRIGNRNFTTISKSVKDKYRKLLTEGYTKEQVVKAIKNAYADDFHKESNFKYLTLEYFSRPKSIDLFGFKEEKFIPNPITDSLYD